MAALASTTAYRDCIDSVRGFNRFYTRQIGVLNEHLLDSPFSLTEMRVLFELAHRSAPTATDLGADLGLDPGYLSRMLRSFEKQGLMRRTASTSDARQNLLSLTPKGRKIFTPYEQRSREQVSALLSRLSLQQQTRLLDAMHTVEAMLTPKSAPHSGYVLRPHRPGDMGWVVQRHGELYWQEYHYDERFEALVAEICGKFIQNLDPDRERCWIAEKESERLGSVFLVKKTPAVAKLRLLLVEPSARGLGIGKRLVEECVRFARGAGYKKILLWTQSELHAARSIYQKAGFQKVAEEKHESWSRRDLVAETWALPI